MMTGQSRTSRILNEGKDAPVYEPVLSVSTEGALDDAFREKWKLKHERIRRENRKRPFALLVQVVIITIALILNFFKIIDFISCIVLILIAMFIALLINHFIHARIQTIIMSDQEGIGIRRP